MCQNGIFRVKSCLKLTLSWGYSLFFRLLSKNHILECFLIKELLQNSLVFGHFWPIFGQKMDPKPPRGHFFPKRIHQNKFQLKIQILSWNLFWWISFGRKWPLGSLGSIFCTNMRNNRIGSRFYFVGFRKST